MSWQNLSSRRRFLQVGAWGALGLTLPDFLRCRAEAPGPGKARSLILVWLGGGPSHHDTFDPKPDAVAEVRGPYAPIATRVPGIIVSEKLPRLAGQMRNLALLRAVTHADAAHEPGVAHMQSGYVFRAGSNYPSISAVVGYERQEAARRNGLPPSIVVPSGGIGAGHLGPGYNPFEVAGNPNDPTFKVQDVSLPDGLTASRLRRRRTLLEDFDSPFRSAKPSEIQRAVDRFTEQAYSMLTSPAAQQAFEVDREPDRLRERYGRTRAGQGLLLARRLVEAGVPCITVNEGEWDHHVGIFPQLDKMLPPLDRSLATLVEDLDQRGLLASTLIVVMGEFGRTPKINVMSGRDHWSRGFTVVLAGGGVRGGQAIGATDLEGAFPSNRPVTPEDLAHSIYTLLGLDPDKELPTISGRRMQMVRDGKMIRELTA